MVTYKLWLFAVLLTVVAGCSPRVAPTRTITAPLSAVAPSSPATPELPAVVSKVSKCISPTASPGTGIDASYEARYFNASSYDKIANLEYLVSQADPDYHCGTLFQETSTGTVRGVKVYELTQGAQKYNTIEAQVRAALDDLDLPYKSSVVIYANFDGLLPKVLLKTGWDTREVSEPSLKTTRLALYSDLAGSNQSVFVPAGSSSKARRDVYNCSDFSSQAAAQAFFSGLTDDVNRLDGDNDGVACEVSSNASQPYRVTIADLPSPAPAAVTPVRTFTPTYTPPTSSGRCYVSGYTRKDGTRVSGYYRSC